MSMKFVINLQNHSKFVFTQIRKCTNKNNNNSNNKASLKSTSTSNINEPKDTSYWLKFSAGIISTIGIVWLCGTSIKHTVLRLKSL